MPSLLEAIEHKYGTDDVEVCELDLPIAIYVPKKSPLNCIPTLLVLNDCRIDSAGNEELLQDKCERVEELDLAQNCLTRWTEVLCILRQMPLLKFANLSFNNLHEDLSRFKSSGTFPHLTNLVLNNTHVDWASVRHFLALLPSLEELHLSLNDFSDVELDDELSDKPRLRHEGVKKLHFAGNHVSEWKEICKLGYAFPNLEWLIVADCPISTLDPSTPCSSPERLQYSRSESECEGSPSRNSPHDSFRHLCFLNVNNTLLSSWEDVDRLGSFPALHCLRLQGCPLFEFPQEYTEHERRQLSIARLPNIQTLNGGAVISYDEREDAERAFIRYYMDKPESDRPERYSDLVSVHGKLDPLVNIDLSPERRVKVTFTCGDCIEDRSIDVYQTVLELKQRLESFSKISVQKMRLFYVDQDMRSITGPEEMKFPNKQLYSYNISNGDEIIIDSKK
uniref:Ubiquitin-like domain-containing protein n=1 Tax=Clastoptera arizonana TaxID=38151 RepID=A0A1B6DSK6_9HEMI